MNSYKLRQIFLNYFADNGHSIVSSSPLVPENDPTLLFTNAGMVQFKNVFLGLEKRKYTSATSVQLCVRAGGKHNDLDNVGYTSRHHTLFEMLGNFSFGKYFKHDAIGYAWEFLTEVLKIPKDKLWVTIHHDDEESASIWLNDIKIDPKRFVRLGDASNFWSMGDTGPCGPCTEIFYDHGDSVSGGPPGSADEDGDRFVEIWNLVFMQYNRDDGGKMHPLPVPCVDTGMGLERLCAVLQSVYDNFETDIFVQLIKSITSLTSSTNNADKSSYMSKRVIADHIRSIAFLLAQGVVPGNEGRSYVLRRIIRRAARHGVKIGLRKPFLYKLLPSLIRLMGKSYPELEAKRDIIAETLLSEEKQFGQTLVRGLKILDEATDGLTNKTLPGDLVFTLYDTYGFPPDMTADIARERDLQIDYKGFDAAMAQQREQSRQFQSFVVDYTKQLHIPGETEFVGYDQLATDTLISHLFHNEMPVPELSVGSEGIIVLEQTPFYAEAGGQIGDKGNIYTPKARFEVLDTKKQGLITMHIGRVIEGSFKQNDTVSAEVDDKRSMIKANHTATHLLHAALRHSLGSHVVQRGSLVTEERLRFDFSHPKPLSTLELQTIEALVNKQIIANLEAKTNMMTEEEVKSSNVIALFDHKYSENLRVLKIGDFSIEACGGTHVAHTGEIGFFKIVAESASASGIRRIEAITGSAAVNWVASIEDKLHKLSCILQVGNEDLVARVTSMQNDLRQKDKELSKLQQRLAGHQTQQLQQQSEDIAGTNILVCEVNVTQANQLRNLIDQFKAKLTPCVILLAARAKDSDKIQLAAGASKDISSTVSARDILTQVATAIGGRGGGRADFAQGGAEASAAALSGALNQAKQWLKQKLE